MPASDPPLTMPTRGGRLDPWELAEMSEIAGIRSQVVAFDRRTESIAAEWRIEQKRERRERERDRRRSARHHRS